MTREKALTDALKEKELKLRIRISRIFLTTAGDETYEKILALVLDMTRSRYGIFGFIDETGEWVCPSLTRDIWEACQVPDKRIAFPHDTWTGIWGQAMTEKKSRYINRQLHLPEGHIDIDNALDAPVVYQDRLVGNLLIGQKDTGYTDDDQDLMEMVADQIAPVLDTRLERDRELKERRQAEIRLQQVQKLEATGSLAGGIAHDFNNILSAILGYAQLAMDRQPCRTKKIHILVVDDDTAIRQMLQQGVEMSGYDCSSAPSGEDALEVLKIQKIDVVITDIVMPGMTGIELTRAVKETHDADVIVMTGYAETYTYEKVIEEGASDFVQKPLNIRELMIRLRRVLRERALFSAKDEAALQLQQMLGQLKKSLFGTIQVIVSMVEKRDPYTAGHQQRVARLACAIAGEMNLSGHVIEGIGMAGAIHDLGKIAVPAEILSKPTQLTKEEFSLVKFHARAGFEILKNIDFPWPVAQIAHQHHERMNGTGYPGGLKGEEILLESRIIAVADTVEAMASHRPYRPALGIDAALEAINQGKGDLYDAQVVDACTQLFSKKLFRFDAELKDQIWPKP